MPTYKGNSAERIANLTTDGSSQIMQDVGGGNWTAPRAGYVRISADAVVDGAIGDPASVTASATTGFSLNADRDYDFSVDAGEAIAIFKA
jgi:hypothetical protein